MKHEKTLDILMARYYDLKDQVSKAKISMARNPNEYDDNFISYYEPEVEQLRQSIETLKADQL